MYVKYQVYRKYQMILPTCIFRQVDLYLPPPARTNMFSQESPHQDLPLFREDLSKLQIHSCLQKTTYQHPYSSILAAPDRVCMISVNKCFHFFALLLRVVKDFPSALPGVGQSLTARSFFFPLVSPGQPHPSPQTALALPPRDFQTG